MKNSKKGTFFGIYDFKLQPDFGGGRAIIRDAYVDARFLPWFQVKGGKFKTPFGIERLQSASALKFVERALPNNLVPDRDLGIELHGDLFNGVLIYSLAYLNGVNDGSTSESFGDIDPNDSKDAVARLFAHPFKHSGFIPLQGLGLGAAVSYVEAGGNPTSTNLPSYRTAGQQTFFSYRTGDTATF
jgi:Phosphate-selective porin